MNDIGVIDRFLDVFSRYIDSGFGLLGGEVVFLASTLVVIDVPDRAAAEAWAGCDPYGLAGLFAKVEIRAWNKVIG